MYTAWHVTVGTWSMAIVLWQKYDYYYYYNNNYIEIMRIIKIIK